MCGDWLETEAQEATTNLEFDIQNYYSDALYTVYYWGYTGVKGSDDDVTLAFEANIHRRSIWRDPVREDRPVFLVTTSCSP